VLAQVDAENQGGGGVHYGGLAVEVDAIKGRRCQRGGVDRRRRARDWVQSSPMANASVRREPDVLQLLRNKNLSTGEGGAIALFDPAMASVCGAGAAAADAWKRSPTPGRYPTATSRELGYKMNYTDLAGAGAGSTAPTARTGGTA